MTEGHPRIQAVRRSTGRFRPDALVKVLATMAAAVLCVDSRADPMCAMAGATYTARPAVPSRDFRYRLRIALPPRADRMSLSAEYWTFETFSRRTGRTLSRLRMVKDCGNGRSPCWVSPPSKPRAEDGFYSEVTMLDRDWRPTAGSRTPYAIVLPGFGRQAWDLAADLLGPDLRYSTPRHVAPDLENQIVWLLARCGPAPHHPRLPGTPLNGPATRDVIQPP